MQGPATTEPNSASGLIPARIVAARVAHRYVVELEFEDGSRVAVDFSEYIRPGTVTGALADPAVFSAVRVGPRGRSLEWPGEVDFCADALRLRAHAT